MAHRARRRFQLIKPALHGMMSVPALRKRGLADANDDMVASFLANSDYGPIFATQCADPSFWASTSGCQTMWPNGSVDALNASTCAVPASIPGMQAKIADLQANWNPTGNYSPADLQAIVTRVNTMTNQVYATLQTFRLTTNMDTSFTDSAAQGFMDLAAQANSYAAGWAPGQTQLVAAPGLKAWVIAAMNGMLNAMQAMAVSACYQSGWSDALSTFEGYLNDVWSAAKAIGGAVLSAGQTLLHVGEAAVGIVAWFIKYAPWLVGGVILAGAGTYFYRWNKTSRRFPSLIPGAV